MVANFIRNINDLCITRLNQTRVKLKDLETGKQNPKVYAQKIAQMWGIRVERAKKTIMDTTQNSIWDVTRPLKKRFWTR